VLRRSRRRATRATPATPAGAPEPSAE
jgi:hypothetical protein